MPDESQGRTVGRRLRVYVRREAPLPGTRTVSAILPSGRTLWLQVEPALGTTDSLRNLARLVDRSAARRASAALDADDQLGRLARSVPDDAGRLQRARLARTHALRRRLVAGDDTLDRRLTQAAAGFRGRLDRQLAIERRAVRRLRRRDLWDKLVIASALPLFAAYGQPGRLFGTNNVTLTLLLALWLVGDDVVDTLLGPQEKSPYPLRDTDAWSYLAPFANLVTGWWLFKDRQHERFIAARTNTPFTRERAEIVGPRADYVYVARIPLAPYLGAAHFRDFATFTGVPAVVTLSEVRWKPGVDNARVVAVSAVVEEGSLTVRLAAVARHMPGDPIVEILESAQVAWMVDTADPGPPEPAS